MKSLLFLCLISGLSSSAQKAFDKISIVNDSCSYSVQIDTSFNDTSQVYFISSFYVDGLTKRACDKLREKFSWKGKGDKVWLDKKSIEEKHSQICSTKKYKLKKVEYLQDKYEPSGRFVIVHYTFVKKSTNNF